MDFGLKVTVYIYIYVYIITSYTYIYIYMNIDYEVHIADEILALVGNGVNFNV